MGITKQKSKKKAKFRLSPLVIALLSVYPQATVFAQGIVVDPSQNNGLNVTVTANDTPLIQIADPNASGVSHNKFTDFNVSNPGVVFNNSTQDGVSQIGGLAMKNPNLTHAATGIITEVTGASASRLEGTLEVFGQQADLIIANENGIAVNGVSTINTGHLTLSTGKVVTQPDGNYTLSVERGNVSVGSGGMSTDNLDYFDIVSRSAILDGKISGKAAVKVLTGLNDYDPQSRTHRVRATESGDTPAVAISGSSMGSMYGSRIQLISTESGAGVRHEGSIISASDIEISASGDISLAGMQAGQDIEVSGKNVTLSSQSDSSGLHAQRDLFITALNQLTLQSNLLSQQGQIRINAGSLLQQAAVIQTNAAATNVDTITIDVMGNYTLSGALKALDTSGNVINNAVIALREGSYVVTVNGKEVAWSTVISDVGVNAKQGNIAIQAGSMDNQRGSIGADAGTLAFTVADVFTSSGMIKASGDISLVSRSLANSGLVRSTGKLDINVTDLANHGSLTAEGNVNLAVSNALENSGVVAGNSSVTLSAKDVTNTGSMVSENALNISADNLTNEGKVHAAGDMTLNVDSTLTNSGSGEIVSGNNLAIVGQDAVIDNSGNATIQANNLTFTGVNTLNNGDGAQLLITEQLSVDRLNSLENSGLIKAADIALNDVVSFNNDGQLEATNTLLLLAKSVNNQGQLQSDGQLLINAAQVSNTAGTVQAGGELRINAEQLQNLLGGNLFSASDIILTLSETLNNTASVIAAGATLTIHGADGAQTLRILNSEGAELSGNDVVVSAAATLTNNNAVIGAAESLDVSNLGSLENTGEDAFIQADSIRISGTDHITNASTVYAGQQLSIENAASLSNAGNLFSDGDLTMAAVQQVDNTGELVATNQMQIRDAAALTNTGLIAADRLTLKNIADISNSFELQASSQLEIQKIDNLKNSGLIYSGDKLTIEDVIQFINSSASEDGTQAQIVAETDLVIQRIDELVNSGDTALINALERLQLLDIAQLANSDRAVINGDLVLILDKIGVLTNASAANISSQNGSLSISADTVTNSGSYTEKVYDADGKLINEVTYASLIAALNDLSINTNTLVNTDGAVISSEIGNISIASTSLSNTQGSAITAQEGDATIAVVNSIDNTGSAIYGTNISVIAEQLDNSELGEISAYNNVLLNLDALKHDGGRVFAENDLRLDINDDFAFAEGSMNANANLIINSTGDISNATRLENYGNVILNATGDFVNQTDSSLVSAGDIAITAASFTNEENTLLWSLGNLSVDVRNGAFVNKQNGNIYSNKAMSLIAKSLLNYAGYIKSGTDMEIDAQEFTNKSIYDNNGWSLSDNAQLYSSYEYKTSGMFVNKDSVSMSLPKWQADITLVGKAELRSGGELKINQRNIYSNSKVINTGGAISSAKDMYITGDLINEPEYTKMTLLEYMKAKFDISLEHHWWGAFDTVHQKESFNNLYDLLNYVYGNASSGLDHKDKYYHVLLGIEKSNNPFEQVMTRLFGETWRNRSLDDMRSRWSALIKNGGQKIADEVVYFLPSDRGSITSGGNLHHSGGSFSNGITNGGVVEKNKVVEVDIGDKTVNTTDAGAQVVVNQKVIAEVSMGISTLPTIEQLTSIPGMFGSSEAFKKLITGTVSNDDLGNVGAIVIIIGDASLTVVPMYETRLDMLDKSKFYGSDYFFSQIGYVSETPVTVIGDSYFINELINRQISTDVGSFFAVRDGLDNEALVKVLMDSAANVSDKLGLVVGEPLTEEQRNNLDEDIVWFVSSTIDGHQVLTPVVYLSVQSQQQLGDGGASTVIHASENVNVDATSINNANGVISAGNNVDLQAEGDITIASSGQDGGVKAGGDISMDTREGDIAVSGSYLESGGDIDLHADNGDISFIASMDRDEEGKQQLHSNKDGVSAGGNLTITGQNVEFNAVDVVAGGDASITATEGDVSFNALQEITSDREIDYKNNGLFSDERTDTQTITSEAHASNLTVGGHLDITAKDDINIEGSEMTAASGEMTAGNDINIGTAEDVSWEKTTVETTELVFGASASGVGHSAHTESSTVSGTSNGTSTGYENDSTEGGNSAGRGKSNGAASMPASAEFKAGVQTTTETTEAQSTINHNASINFGSSGSFTADGTVDIGGGDFAMDEMSIDAENVASTKYVDETKTTTSTTQEFWGVKGEGHSAVADAANKYTAMGMETHDSDTEVNGGEVAASVIGDGTNLIFNDLAGGSVSLGYERKESATSTVQGQENTTQIDVGSLTIKSKEDTELNGVAVNADSVNIAVGGDLDINSAKSWESQDSWSATNNAGLSLGAGAGVTGAGVGASLDYSHYEEQAHSESVTHTNGQINAGSIDVNVGGDMTMAGANITAGEANIDVGGELNIISQQDTYNSEASSWQTTESVGIAISTSGVIPTFTAGGGAGDEFRNEALVGEQSGITTGGPVNITTGGDLNLTGGHIVSEDQSGSVNVGGDINATTLEDSIEQDGLYGGASVGIDQKGTIMGSGYVKTIEEVHFQENQHATIDVGSLATDGGIKGELNTDVGNMSEVIEDRVVAGSDISWTIGGQVPSKNNGSGPADRTPGHNDGGPTDRTPGHNDGGPTDRTPDHNDGGPTYRTPDHNDGGPTDRTPDHNDGGPTDRTPDHNDSGPTDRTPDASDGGPADRTPDSNDGGTVERMPDSDNSGPAERQDALHDAGPAKQGGYGNDVAPLNHLPTSNDSGTGKQPDSGTDGNRVHEMPTNTSDAGNAKADRPQTVVPDAGKKPSVERDNSVTRRPKSKWQLTPQGNLKGGSNVGTIKDTDAIRKGRESWSHKYESRNSLKEE